MFIVLMFYNSSECSASLRILHTMIVLMFHNRSEGFALLCLLQAIFIVLMFHNSSEGSTSLYLPYAIFHCISVLSLPVETFSHFVATIGFTLLCLRFPLQRHIITSSHLLSLYQYSLCVWPLPMETFSQYSLY